MRTRLSNKKVLYFFFSLFCVILLGLIFYPLVNYVCGESRYIKTIVQKTSSQDVLKCSYLAELLGLTAHKKVYLYQFDAKEGVSTLCACALIKEASIKKIKPNALFIEYRLRKPIAYVADFANTAIDEEGVLFPFSPFYTPKYLPEIYFGASFSTVWGKKMEEKKIALAREIFSIFPPYAVLWVDLSKSLSANLGEREIIVELKNHLLRLSPTEYKNEIAHYLLLNKTYLSEKKERCIIDLRLPDVAFICDYPTEAMTHLTHSLVHVSELHSDPREDCSSTIAYDYALLANADTSSPESELVFHFPVTRRCVR